MDPIYTEVKSGKVLNILDLKEEDILIDDIAESLSKQCRFNGHCDGFYSVAQHSVNVMKVIEDEDLKIDALMHDAAEAYIGDIIAPVKNKTNIAEIESIVHNSIANKFGLYCRMPEEVHEADTRMLMTEKRDVVKSTNFWGKKLSTYKPYPKDVFQIEQLMSPEEAKEAFLDAFYDLMKYHDYVIKSQF